MTLAAQRLNAYLAQARSCTDNTEADSIVIGNEAADLDSMVSAILYAYLISACGAPGKPPVVPVINCPRADLVLRTESVYLFTALDLDLDKLLFIDEIDLKALHRKGRLRLTLVDHNALSGDQGVFGDAVVAIIDHHADSGRYPGANPRIIETVGSTATLVAEAMLRDKPMLIDSVSSTLLLGTILLDTVNLDPGAGRVTEKDRAMATRLGEVCNRDAGDLFTKLQAEKFNVSNLGTGDLLRKDYKTWATRTRTYGMSTVLIPIEDWIARDPDLIEGMKTFAVSHDLACLVAMMAYTDTHGMFRRDLALCAGDSELLAELTGILEAGDLDLNRIQPAGLAASDQVMLFTQGNISISRKKLQPMLHQFFSRGID